MLIVEQAIGLHHLIVGIVNMKTKSVKKKPNHSKEAKEAKELGRIFDALNGIEFILCQINGKFPIGDLLKVKKSGDKLMTVLISLDTIYQDLLKNNNLKS